MRRLERCFVTGCDQVTEWMLPWFLSNYRKHNNTPIVFADFGVTPETLVWCEKNFDEVLYHDNFVRWAGMLDNTRWYLKPVAIARTDAHMKVWLDTDCEVLGNISGIFDRLVERKLNMVLDRPWTNRRNEIWHNTGVVGAVGNPDILTEWIVRCKDETGGYTIGLVKRGDQDALHDLLGQNRIRRDFLVHELPNIYNWLRIQLLDGEDHPKKLVVHWTGQKGKEEIRRKMKG